MTTLLYFEPQAQQAAVVEWAINGQGHANVVARAGCGKTFTLMAMVDALKVAKPGRYKVEAQFYGHRQQVVTGATTL